MSEQPETYTTEPGEPGTVTKNYQITIPESQRPWYRGLAASDRAYEAMDESSVPTDDPELRRAMYWFYVGQQAPELLGADADEQAQTLFMQAVSMNQPSRKVPLRLEITTIDTAGFGLADPDAEPPDNWQEHVHQQLAIVLRNAARMVADGGDDIKLTDSDGVVVGKVKVDLF